MDWDAWARAFETMDGPDAFAALFAPEGRFCDPVTPWTTDVRKVAIDTDAIFPDWNQRVDRIRGGDDWAVFEWTGTGTFRRARARPGIPIVMQGATVVEVDARRQGHLVARLPRHQRAHPADSRPGCPANAGLTASGLGGHRLRRGPCGPRSYSSAAASSSAISASMSVSAKPITPMSSKALADLGRPTGRCP